MDHSGRSKSEGRMRDDSCATRESAAAREERNEEEVGEKRDEEGYARGTRET